jgi:hypothetical protein
MLFQVLQSTGSMINSLSRLLFPLKTSAPGRPQGVSGQPAILKSWQPIWR